MPAREDVRDVLVGARLADLPDGARIGTGAPRRAMQLLDWARREGRHLEVVPVRGNVDTRIDLARGGGLDAVVLAGAGLRRLGYLGVELSGSDKEDTVVRGLPAEVLDESLMLPAPGSGGAGPRGPAVPGRARARGGRPARRRGRARRDPRGAGVPRDARGGLHRTGRGACPRHGSPW